MAAARARSSTTSDRAPPAGQRRPRPRDDDDRLRLDRVANRPSARWLPPMVAELLRHPAGAATATQLPRSDPDRLRHNSAPSASDLAPQPRLPPRGPAVPLRCGLRRANARLTLAAS